MLYIRQAESGELGALAELELRSAAHERRLYPLDCSASELTAVWRQRYASGNYEILLAALRSGADLTDTVAGFIGFTARAGEAAFVQAMYIEPAFFRKGVGSRLFAAAEKLCRDRGCTHIDLHVEPLNTAGIGFYGRAGFRRLPRKKRHLLILRKEL